MRPIPLLLVAFLLAGCTLGAPAPGTPGTPDSTSNKVTLLTYSAFGVNKSVFDAFTARTGYQVDVIAKDDAAALVNQAIVTKDAPVGDVLFGVDNALIYRAREHGLFQPYEGNNSRYEPERFKAPFRGDNDSLLATPIDFGYVEFNLDPAWFSAHNLTPPTALAQLADTTYAPLTVVENPQTSSPGQAFLLATVATLGENGSYPYTSFWRDFHAHGGAVSASWDDAYFAQFTQGGGDGPRDRPIVLSYSTSPAYGPMYGENATSAVLDLRGASWFQVEAMGVLAHAKNVKGAQALIDYMTTLEVQQQVAAQQVEYPVVAGAQAPDAYVTYAPQPLDPAFLEPQQIEAHREAWLAGWRDATGLG